MRNTVSLCLCNALMVHNYNCRHRWKSYNLVCCRRRRRLMMLRAGRWKQRAHARTALLLLLLQLRGDGRDAKQTADSDSSRARDVWTADRQQVSVDCVDDRTFAYVDWLRIRFCQRVGIAALVVCLYICMYVFVWFCQTISQKDNQIWFQCWHWDTRCGIDCRPRTSKVAKLDKNTQIAQTCAKATLTSNPDS